MNTQYKNKLRRYATVLTMVFSFALIAQIAVQAQYPSQIYRDRDYQRDRRGDRRDRDNRRRDRDYRRDARRSERDYRRSREYRRYESRDNRRYERRDNGYYRGYKRGGFIIYPRSKYSRRSY